MGREGGGEGRDFPCFLAWADYSTLIHIFEAADGPACVPREATFHVGSRNLKPALLEVERDGKTRFRGGGP